MPGIYAFVLGGGVLALVGWAAWTLSGGFTTVRPGPDTPYQHGLDRTVERDQVEHEGFPGRARLRGGQP